MESTPASKAPETVDFYGRNFFVTPDVLRPRPETEGLIDGVKSLAGLPILPGVKPKPRVLPKNPIILDVGTGSGILAITITLELAPLSPTVFASDLSEKALKVARTNAKNLSAPVTFFASDLLTSLPSAPVDPSGTKVAANLSGATPDSSPINLLHHPDLIVANLPYVDRTWSWLSPTLSKDPEEPDLALFADDHGLALIKRLIAQSADRQVKYLILEADPSQHDAIIAYAKNYRYETKKTEGFILSLEQNPPD